MSNKSPNFSHELPFWNNNLLVAGADEVGRGCFAGPLVVAAVIFPPNIKISVEINDSKKLSQKKRELAANWIINNALAYSYGQTEADYINQKGIVPATHYAFQNAINNIKISSEMHILTDAFEIPNLKYNQTPIIKGDSISLSIAAASIIAKVYRDNLMQKLHKTYPEYDWENNKGYGTKKHREALKKYGITNHHRTLFCKKYI